MNDFLVCSTFHFLPIHFLAVSASPSRRDARSGKVGQVGQVRTCKNAMKQGTWPTLSNLTNFFEQFIFRVKPGIGTEANEGNDGRTLRTIENRNQSASKQIR